jgi:aldehyde:ferredoxin oxidoreductase
MTTQLPYGYIGKVLRVDLTNKTVTIEQPDDTIYRRYLCDILGHSGVLISNSWPQGVGPSAKTCWKKTGMLYRSVSVHALMFDGPCGIVLYSVLQKLNTC